MNESEVTARLNIIGNAIAKKVFPGYGFVLLIFAKDDPSNANYISNVRRSDIVEAFEEAARKLRSHTDLLPDRES